MDELYITSQYLEYLTRFSTLVTTHPLDDDVLNDLLNIAMQLITAQDAILITNDATLAHALNQPQIVQINALPTTAQLADSELTQWIIDQRDMLCIDDVHAAGWYADVLPIQSVIGLPIMHATQLFAIWVFVHQDRAAFTEFHQQSLTLLSQQLGAAWHQRQHITRLQNQQYQLAGILDAIPDGVLVLDAKGHLITANRTALPLLGLTALPSDHIIKLQDLVEQGQHVQMVAEVIEETADNPLLGRDLLTVESRFDALGKDMFITLTLWHDAAKETYGYVVVWHDVTDMRDLLRFKDEMLRLASHDLRSPLNLIVGYADMIALDTEDPESSIHSHIAVIQRSTRKMNNLLEDLLRIEQIRNSPLELHEQINPVALIKVVIVNSRPEADTKNITCTADLPDSLPNIQADRVLIRQAMENLINNAIKYTPASGSVQVRAALDESGFVFEVEDNGPGIPEDKQPYLFEAFYRVEHNGQKTYGSGLGLNLVKTVIERHQGSVYVESTPGQGSCFGFRIPVGPQANHVRKT